MVSQAKGGCRNCGKLGHTKMNCPLIAKKPIPRKAPVKKTTAKKPGKATESRSKLVKKLDAIFSQYIRLKDAEWRDGELQAMCVTSGEWKPWKQQQNGHFYSRGRLHTRWDETNCHVQSYRDNVLLKGNYINYTRYMIDRYGREAVDELERKSLSKEKISTPQIKEWIEEYTSKVNQLLKE